LRAGCKEREISKNRHDGPSSATRGSTSRTFEISDFEHSRATRTLAHETEPGKQVLLSARELLKAVIENIATEFKSHQCFQRLSSAGGAFKYHSVAFAAHRRASVPQFSVIAVNVAIKQKAFLVTLGAS
jgi:hypothetical protein